MLFAALPVCDTPQAGSLPAVSNSCSAASVIPGVPSDVPQMVALSPDYQCMCLGAYCSLLPGQRTLLAGPLVCPIMASPASVLPVLPSYLL